MCCAHAVDRRRPWAGVGLRGERGPGHGERCAGSDQVTLLFMPWPEAWVLFRVQGKLLEGFKQRVT